MLIKPIYAAFRGNAKINCLNWLFKLWLLNVLTIIIAHSNEPIVDRAAL